MAGVRQKGKIPSTQWATIVARHKAHEPIAKIARDYGCTAPAIRYIVKRAALRVEGGTAAQSLEPTPGTERKKVGKTRALDPAVRDRITSEIAAFLCVLDVAVNDPRRESIDGLRQSADRLMRAAARVRIDLERGDNSPT